MKDEHKELTLWGALAVVQRDAPVIRKTETANIEGQKPFSYNFAGYVTVWDQVGGLMGDLGLVWSARPNLEVMDGGQTRFVVDYTLHHLPTGEELTGKYPVKGESPQQMGGGITYARRYALVAILNLRVAEDDDDAVRAEAQAGMTPSQQAQATRAPRKAAAQKAPARPRQAPAPMDDRPVPKNPQAPASVDTRNKVFALVRGEMGLTDREHYLAYVNEILAKHQAGPVESTNDLTQEQAGWVIETAEAALAGPPVDAGRPAESEG